MLQTEPSAIPASPRSPAPTQMCLKEGARVDGPPPTQTSAIAQGCSDVKELLGFKPNSALSSFTSEACGAVNRAVRSAQATFLRAGDLRAPKETLVLESGSARNLYALHVHDQVG